MKKPRRNHSASLEVAHGRADFSGVGLQGEMAAIDKADLGVRDVPSEGFGTRRNEERIVLAPDTQQRRPFLSQIGLNVTVECDVRLVVPEQVQLDLVITRARQCPELKVRMQNRLMLSRISSAVLVHTKSLAPRLLAARYSRMACSSSAVLR